MLKNKCILWYHNEFKLTPIWNSMVNVRENSPWHREQNIAIHTDMVVSEYITRCPPGWNKFHVLGFLTCVFHDVGKPLAEIYKYSETRGNYKAYHGHELISSRIWEDFIHSNSELISYFGLSDHDLYGITWMIEYHLPWSTTNHKKLQNYAETITKILKCDNYVFTNILLADTYGRIADDSDKKRNDAIEWCNTFNELCKEIHISGIKSSPSGSINVPSVEDNSLNKCLYIPIGPSGVGKSTYFKTLENTDLYSLDVYREELYPRDTYCESFKAACEDKKFMNKAHAEFMKLIKNGNPIYADEMNLTKKKRNFVIVEARKKGYKIIAITFPISIGKLIEQQENRTDKKINKEIYSSMYSRVQQPSYGEFDEIMVNINE